MLNDCNSNVEISKFYNIAKWHRHWQLFSFIVVYRCKDDRKFKNNESSFEMANAEYLYHIHYS
jgi:hypothetical protein